MQEWIISRSISKGLIWHLQARTADQMSSFALLASDEAPMTCGKTADGKFDLFTCMSDQGHATMNVLGKIRYEGTWPKARKTKGTTHAE